MSIEEEQENYYVWEDLNGVRVGEVSTSVSVFIYFVFLIPHFIFFFFL